MYTSNQIQRKAPLFLLNHVATILMIARANDRIIWLPYLLYKIIDCEHCLMWASDLISQQITKNKKTLNRLRAEILQIYIFFWRIPHSCLQISSIQFIIAKTIQLFWRWTICVAGLHRLAWLLNAMRQSEHIRRFFFLLFFSLLLPIALQIEWIAFLSFIIAHEITIPFENVFIGFLVTFLRFVCMYLLCASFLFSRLLRRATPKFTWQDMLHFDLTDRRIAQQPSVWN